MTSILLDCPECGADAEARVHIVDDADVARELLEYLCSEGCEGTVVAELWNASVDELGVNELGAASPAAPEPHELVSHIA
jgi:hypothetical protein